MAQSLLFIPDISGYTHFIQTTEAEHSSHVIAELLEVLLQANTQDLQLAEIEGDALFFYKENYIPSQEQLLAQVETMFTAFYSHLKVLEKNRICPCNACATAPNLELKIIVHAGELQFLDIQGRHKPFGKAVIEAHRLLKNSVASDTYTLVSGALADTIGLSSNYNSQLFSFSTGSDHYDGDELTYVFAPLNPSQLALRSFPEPELVSFSCEPCLSMEREFPLPAEALLEIITNYRNRHHWVEGVQEFKFNPNEVTRIGTEHTCVVDGKHLEFTTVTKLGQPGEIIYGERTQSLPIADNLHQFYIVSPLGVNRCKLKMELYWQAKSPLKKLMLLTFGKRSFKKSMNAALTGLHNFVLHNSQAA